MKSCLAEVTFFKKKLPKTEEGEEGLVRSLICREPIHMRSLVAKYSILGQKLHKWCTNDGMGYNGDIWVKYAEGSCSSMKNLLILTFIAFYLVCMPLICEDSRC